ncbi:MAG: PD-(D/E)XK nuclease family protein, partial [Aeromicrobium sp.]
DSCGASMALKIRPDVRSDRWQRSFGSEKTFILGEVVQLVRGAHVADEANDPATLPAWLQEQLERRKVHRLLRPYAMKAVPNVLQAHWDIEDEIGELRMIRSDPSIGQPPKTLWVWAPLYCTEFGIREIRRYRLGGAHARPTEDDMIWAHTAAHIAAKYDAQPAVTRVRVVEIGAGDGSLNVLFDGSPEQATREYDAHVRQIAAELGDHTDIRPGFGCSSCKIAGICEALTPVPGMLGQAGKGYASRSVAPSDLDRYRTCPAQWLMASDLHLPRTDEYTEAQTRGLLVHEWLETAHRREIGCTDADLPEPGTGMGLAQGVMTPEEYAVAHPFLRHHVSTCPLAADSVKVLEVEQSSFGFDADADVVAVTKPDLIYRIGDRLVVREFKTSSSLPKGGAEQLYSQTTQVAFLLSMLSSGLKDAYGASTATLEVEVLTPDGSEMYAWDLEDDDVLAHARDDLAAAANRWHLDSTWETNPGDHCLWCPVRQWCPDSDAFQKAVGGTGVSGPALDPIDDPPPPF